MIWLQWEGRNIGMINTPQHIREQIREAKEKRLQKLNLSFNQLTRVPDAISQLQNLTSLNLGKSFIPALFQININRIILN